MASITKQVEVEVDFDAEDYLDEIEDKRLKEEVEDRGYYVEGKEEDECRKRMPQNTPSVETSTATSSATTS